jgi:uncharacterized membrane protein (DUF4010 family)
MMASPWFNFAVALALGLLIGLERERSKGEGPSRRAAGVRTFALVALFGAIATHLGGVVLLAIATVAVAGLTAMAYLRTRDEDPGLTTEIGLTAAPLLGGLAMSDILLASGLGVVIAVLLAAKVPLHNFVKAVLTDAEVNDGLVFGLTTLVVWPQLPDRYMGPLQALNPHMLWLLVILVLAIGACGHVATRLFGAQYGLPIAGLASGFISSTATIGSMAARVIKEPASLPAAVAGAALSTVATFLQMPLLLLTISQPTLLLMTPALTAGVIAAALYGLVFTLQALKSAHFPDLQPGQAFSIKTALGLAATMAVMLIAAAALRDHLGEAGLLAGTTLAGLVDPHSAAISVASLAGTGKLDPKDTLVPILAAMTSNTLIKIIMAIVGGTAFALRIVPGLVLTMAAAWIAEFATVLR